MASEESLSSCVSNNLDAEQPSTAKRKRVRSGSSDSAAEEDDFTIEPKKASVSALDLNRVVLDNHYLGPHHMDRVALLDAGAQYGKVSCVCTLEKGDLSPCGVSLSVCR